MPTLNDVLAGSQAQAVQVQQIIDALKGTPNKGVPVALVSLNDTSNYALTVQNDDPINSRALSVLKADGTTLISADATGVTLGAPVNLQASSVSGTSLADASITNAKLGPDVARANLLTNGGVEIWSRGAGPFTANAAYTADRWQINLGGSSTISVTKDTTNQDVGSAACAACVYTHNTASQFFQKLEDLAGLKTRTITFSARVRTSTASAVRLFLDGAASRTYSAFHTGGGTYETLTVTVTVIAGAGVVQLGMDLNVSCTVYFDNVMLVAGSQAANYAPLHPADDLARCLRYYEIVGTLGNEIFVSSYGGAAVASTAYFALKARKPVTPTFTKNATWNLTNCSQPVVVTGSVDSVTLGTTVTALGAASYNNGVANANVTVEANP